MLRFIRSLSRDQRGVTALEYAVLGGVVVIAVAAVGTYLEGGSGGTSGLPGLFSTLISNATAKMN